MTKHLKVLLTVRPLWLLAVVVVAAFLGGLFTPVSQPVRGPLVSIENTILIAALVALGVLVGNLYVSRGQDLARIGKLEADVKAFREENSTLRDTLSAAASFINRVGLRLISGRGPWPQPPEQIASHIDAELWEDIPPGGTD